MKEVRRIARVGEKVKIVNAHDIPETAGKPDYKNGSILEIVRMSDDYAGYSTECGKLLYEDEYVVLEGEKEMRFKVGDVVKIASCKHRHKFRIGERVRIVKATDTNYYAELIENGEGWWIEDDEIQPAPFTLSDLKPCMVVRQRRGDLKMVSESKDGLVLVGAGWTEFSGYTDDLLFIDKNDAIPSLDIVEVYDFSNVMVQSADIALGNRNLIWKREEPKPKRKMTMEEICKELGEEIEIVEGE